MKKRILSGFMMFVLSLTAIIVGETDVKAATNTISNQKYYIIQNVNSGRFMEVVNGNIVAGANIAQGILEYDTSLSNIFYVMGPENGVNSSEYHQIAAAYNTSLVVDVNNASNSDGANIKLFNSNGGYGAQSYKFVPNGDGSFRIYPYLSSTRVLSVAGSSTTSGANVELATWNNLNSQKWVFKEIVPGEDVSYIQMGWSYIFRGSAASNYQRISTRFSANHVGIDLPAAEGTALYSPCSATVTATGWENSMGYYVILKTTAKTWDNENLTIRMMHLYALPLVSTGDTISSSTQVGYVGNTGDGSTGPHLHIDINSAGYINGSDIRNHFPSCAVAPERVFASILFKYGSTTNYTYT